MLSRESNVRISIVVPYLGDAVAFEETLVSVLENRPAGAEVWVAHDGSYQDPFELGDEVRFVTALSSDLVSLVAAAAESARSQWIHVIGGGVRATHEWTRGAIDCFHDDSVAVVAPVARCAPEGTVTAAGWGDSAVDVIAPVGRGATQVTRRQAATVRGAYLLASFWRKSELQAACRAFGLHDPVAAEFAWSRLLSDNGWRCEVATDSVVVAGDHLFNASPSYRRGQTLRSLSSEIDQRAGLAAVAQAVIGSLLRPGRWVSPAHWAQLLGQASTLLGETSAVRAIRYDEIGSPGGEASTLPLTRPAVGVASQRQAA